MPERAPQHVCTFLLLVTGTLAALPGGCRDRPPRESPGKTQDMASVRSPDCPVGNHVPDRIRFAVGGFWGADSGYKTYQPVADFLTGHLDVPVELVADPSYDHVVNLLEQGEVELALLPPLSYVMAREKMPCLKHLRTMVVDGSVYYSGYILVHRDSGISSLTDLAGRRIGFVDPSSASGYLIPMARLQAEGLKPERDLQNAVFLHTHDAVIRAVLDRKVAAGATFQGALKVARQKELDTGSLRVLAVTGRIPLDSIVVRAGLDPTFVEKLMAALDELNATNTEGRRALRLLRGINGWVPSDDALYEPVRETLAKVRNNGKEAP